MIPVPFEPLKATGPEVFTVNDGTRVCRVTCSPDSFDIPTSRAYAALFAGAGQLLSAARQARAHMGADNPAHQLLGSAIAACEPRSKGDVFKPKDRRTRHPDILLPEIHHG